MQKLIELWLDLQIFRHSLFFAGLVVIARGPHTIPFRTGSLNPSAPMVLCLKARESRSLPALLRTDKSLLDDCISIMLLDFLIVWGRKFGETVFGLKVFARIVIGASDFAVVIAVRQAFKIVICCAVTCCGYARRIMDFH